MRFIPRRLGLIVALALAFTAMQGKQASASMPICYGEEQRFPCFCHGYFMGCTSNSTSCEFLCAEQSVA